MFDVDTVVATDFNVYTNVGFITPTDNSSQSGIIVSLETNLPASVSTFSTVQVLMFPYLSTLNIVNFNYARKYLCFL